MALSGANDSGVYPGLDVNGDNVPDTDQNGNGLPDWEEAFLFYWSDPPEFIYDIDFNNNSLPDLTENDDRPDYPYDRDTKGRHAFLSWDRPLPYVELLRLGFYHAETISQGGESDVLYLRYHLGYDVGERGHVKLRGDWKQVEDDIDNPVFLWLTTGNPRDNSLVLQDTEPDPITGAAPGFGLEGLRLTDADPMLMRNSTVNTVNLVADLTPLDRLTWHSSYKWLRNRQHDEELSEGTMQEEETLSRLTMSTRLEYRYPLREHIELFARYRHLFWHDAGYSPATRRHWQTRGPLFEEVVRLTERTELVAGQEGIPWLMPVTHTDYDDDARDFDRWTNVFMLRMQGQYIGWKTVSEIGLQLERLEAEAGEQSNRTFFVEMYFGF
jgi:hypothetical protein